METRIPRRREDFLRLGHMARNFSGAGTRITHGPVVGPEGSDMVTKEDIGEQVTFPGMSEGNTGRLIGMTPDGWAITRETTPEGFKRVDEFPAALVEVVP